MLRYSLSACCLAVLLCSQADSIFASEQYEKMLKQRKAAYDAKRGIKPQQPQQPPRESQFGKGDCPPLKDCLTYSDETGDWVMCELTYWVFRSPFRFLPTGEFFMKLVLDEETGPNRFGRIRVVSPRREYIRKGTWSLERRAPTPEDKEFIAKVSEKKTDFQYGSFPATLHILTLDFQNNANPTEWESKNQTPINGKVTLLLDERENLKTSKTQLVWLLVSPPRPLFVRCIEGADSAGQILMKFPE